MLDAPATVPSRTAAGIALLRMVKRWWGQASGAKVTAAMPAAAASLAAARQTVVHGGEQAMRRNSSASKLHGAHAGAMCCTETSRARWPLGC